MAGSVLAVLLTACAGFIPGVGPAPNLYELTPKSAFSPDLPDVTWQLVVDEPFAAGGLDTNRIAVRPTPLEVKYFADARWVDRAPTMVQTLLVDSFENTGKIVAVSRQAIGLRSDYNLQTDLREFQAEYFHDGGIPIVRVRINAKIIKQPRQTIIASQSFERTVQVDASGMLPIIAAFDEAVGKVVKGLVEWTLRAASSS